MTTFNEGICTRDDRNLRTLYFFVEPSRSYILPTPNTFLPVPALGLTPFWTPIFMWFLPRSQISLYPGLMWTGRMFFLYSNQIEFVEEVVKCTVAVMFQVHHVESVTAEFPLVIIRRRKIICGVWKVGIQPSKISRLSAVANNILS